MDHRATAAPLASWAVTTPVSLKIGWNSDDPVKQITPRVNAEGIETGITGPLDPGTSYICLDRSRLNLAHYILVGRLLTIRV
jgi:hypothetical protein